MNTAHRNALRALDRALIHLAEERARVLAESGGPAPAGLRQDLLRRHEGRFSPRVLAELLAALDRACGAAEVSS